jgi:hypothetical protein
MLVEETLEKRGQIYGKFTSHARISQDLKEVMHATGGWGSQLPDEREALEMIQHKIARVLNGAPHADNWLDIAGYATLVYQRMTRRNNAETKAA